MPSSASQASDRQCPPHQDDPGRSWPQRSAEHGAAAAQLAPGLLDRQARLAHPALAHQGHHGCSNTSVFGNGSQPGLHLVQQGLAALEQAAEAGMGQGFAGACSGPHSPAGRAQKTAHLGSLLIVPPEGLAGIALDRFEALQVGLLQCLLGWVLDVVVIPLCPRRRRGDEQPLAVQ